MSYEKKTTRRFYTGKGSKSTHLRGEKQTVNRANRKRIKDRLRSLPWRTLALLLVLGLVSACAPTRDAQGYDPLAIYTHPPRPASFDTWPIEVRLEWLKDIQRGRVRWQRDQELRKLAHYINQGE